MERMNGREKSDLARPRVLYPRTEHAASATSADRCSLSSERSSYANDRSLNCPTKSSSCNVQNSEGKAPTCAELQPGGLAPVGAFLLRRKTLNSGISGDERLAQGMFGSKGALLLALCAWACGSSSSGRAGTGGSDPGVVVGQGGAGSGTGGSAGASGLPSAGTSGASGAASGSAASGAGPIAGAGHSGAACATNPFCGGDLVGDWVVKQVCLEIGIASVESICGLATVNLTPLMAKGTVSFKADQTVAWSDVFSYKEDISIPAVCGIASSATSCATFATELSAGDGVSDSQCSYDAVTGCSCSLTRTESPMSSGTYELHQVSSVWVTTSPAYTEADDYCVAGNTLTLRQRRGDEFLTTILTK